MDLITRRLQFPNIYHNLQTRKAWKLEQNRVPSRTDTRITPIVFSYKIWVKTSRITYQPSPDSMLAASSNCRCYNLFCICRTAEGGGGGEADVSAPQSQLAGDFNDILKSFFFFKFLSSTS
jgi:hypothetical protein